MTDSLANSANSQIRQRKAGIAAVHQGPLSRVAQITVFTPTIFTSNPVSPETATQRIAICRQCDGRRVKSTGVEWCGICNCRVAGKDLWIDSLATYEENLPRWGCKHPLRRHGKGWPMLATTKTTHHYGSVRGHNIVSSRCGDGTLQSPPMNCVQVACVITCHNYGRFLSQCLDSCLRQTIPFANIALVDDASADNTRLVALEYTGRGVRYLRTEFRNYSLARNAGYKMLPSGSHVLFVDADNWLPNDYVEQLLRGFENANIGACYGNLLLHQGNRPVGLSKSVHAPNEGSLEQCNIADACSLMRYEAFEQVGMWSEAGTVMSDWSLWLRFRRMGWRMQFCPDAILNYRIHGQQMSVAWRTDPRKVVEAAPKESALIAVVTLFSGRAWALTSYARFLHGLQWNRKNIVVVAVDNSGNLEFSKQLETMLRVSGYVHILVPDATQAVVGVSSERFAADPRLRQKYNPQLAVQIARLYAVGRQFVPAAATHVWTIEDDIEPPADALKHLMFGLYRFRQAGMIGGLARSRFGARWIAWDNGKPFEAPAPGDYKEVTETGFLCALFPRSVWDTLAFRPGPGVPAGNIAYDHTACRDIRSMGRKVLISGSVHCKHWQRNGTWV